MRYRVIDCDRDSLDICPDPEGEIEISELRPNWLYYYESMENTNTWRLATDKEMAHYYENNEVPDDKWDWTVPEVAVWLDEEEMMRMRNLITADYMPIMIGGSDITNRHSDDRLAFPDPGKPEQVLNYLRLGYHRVIEMAPDTRWAIRAEDCLVDGENAYQAADEGEDCPQFRHLRRCQLEMGQLESAAYEWKLEQEVIDRSK